MGDFQPLKFWLDSILLSEYYDNFVQSGITTQQQCESLSDGQLINLGVTLQGHRRRILTHLPSSESGRWVKNMDEPIPSIPPKTKSIRQSYLFTDKDQDESMYHNLDAFGSNTECRVSTPKPVPRPRTKSHSKQKQATSNEDTKPQPMKRPTPAPRKTISKHLENKNSAVSPSQCKNDTGGDSGLDFTNPLSVSVKIDGACMDESYTDRTSFESPQPCYQTGDSSDAQYNLFAATPDVNFVDHTLPGQDIHQDSELYENLEDQEELRKRLETAELYSLQTVQSEKTHSSEKSVKEKQAVGREKSFENATFDPLSNRYVLKPEDVRVFDPLNSPEQNASNIPETCQPGTGVSAESEQSEPDNESTYEPIWMPKRGNPAVNTQEYRSSNLMEFSPLPEKQFEFPKKQTSDSVLLRTGIASAGKSRESFNMPPPAFDPPPLPNSDESTNNSDPSVESPDMPPVPPRPSNYVKSATFKPYENVQFLLSGESPTMPSDSNMEPDAVISPQPIAHPNTVSSITDDPFKNKDPFGEFTPDDHSFDDSSPARKSPRNKLTKTAAVYEVAADMSVPKASHALDGGAIYDFAEDPADFDPFGLRSSKPVPIRSVSNASSESTGSHNLNFVPPAPNWSQKSSQAVFTQGGLEEDDVSSNESLDLLDNISNQTDPDDSMSSMSPVEILPATALSPRKRERSGYLYKQGGIKQNKGWKKRWVIFDGKTLRYYSNSKDQVSKRIVPLSCMMNVEMDIKPNNSRQFKFKLKCTNRVFLFATDSLDDCKMWSSTLMEAIINYKKPDGGEVPGGDMANPDIQGWMKINRNRLKFYVTLKKHKLCYYQSLDDYKMASPLHEIDMKLSAVKEVERTKLQLSTHYSQFMLHFESSSESANWKMALEEAITDALGDNTILDQVKENPDNIHCADCGASESHWASMNLGIVLCVKCAGIHRSFDYRLSKIRSLRMDTKVWNSSLIEVFKEIGNKNANKFWLCHQPPGQYIDENTPGRERKEYIVKKYKERSFCDIHSFASDQIALNEALLSAAQTSDVLLTMKILLSGAEVLYNRPGEPNSTAYELAKEAHQRIQMEFLLQNGGDKTQNFMPGSEEASLVAKLRAEVQFQGYLFKTGSNMKDFLRRWVVLEHGHISYYDSEESKVENDRIDSEAILCLQATSTEKHPFCIELSTKKGNNRVFLFAAVSDEERLQWLRYMAQIFCPVSLMDQMKQKEFTFAGYAHVKTGFNRDWQRTWYMLEKRKLFFTDKEQQEREEDSLDLRKVTNITKITSGMSACEACLESGGPQFVLNAPDRALYLQADLTKDTERMFSVLEIAIKKGGDILEDQPLDSTDVPVIISQCVNFIQLHGLKMKGIYREAAQNSRVQALLDRFRDDARSVVLRQEDHRVHEVCNVLKRFLRNLTDPLLTEQLYRRWIHTASECDHNTKLHWYKYLLQQLPRVHYVTLLSLSNHLNKLSKHAGENLMTLDNISIAFGSTLMKSSAEGVAINTNNIGGAMQMEMKVISDIVTYYDWLFDIQEAEARKQTIEEQIRKAENKLIEMSDGRKSIAPADEIIIFIHFLDSKGSTESVKIYKHTTAQDVVKILVTKMKLPTNVWCLHEMIKEELERPLHPQSKLWPLINEWQNWPSEFAASAHLVMKNNLLKEKIEKAYDPCKPLFAEMKYGTSDKKRFVKMAFEFTQAKLSCYKDSKNVNNAANSWNIEDLSVYKGCDSKRSPPSKWTFSFVCKGEKIGEKEYFGRTVCCATEQDLMSWLGAMMMSQWRNKLNPLKAASISTPQNFHSIQFPSREKRNILGTSAIILGAWLPVRP